MIKNILLTIENYTYDMYNNKYTLTNLDKRFIDETIYNNTTSKETIEFFKSLGGYGYNEKSNTVNFGRRITKNISVSPDIEYKTVRTYDFTDAYEE